MVAGVEVAEVVAAVATGRRHGIALEVVYDPVGVSRAGGRSRQERV